jgi:hypothetical protein
LKGIFHLPGVGFQQLVLLAQAAMRPRCGIITGAKIIEFGEKPIA